MIRPILAAPFLLCAGIASAHSALVVSAAPTNGVSCAGGVCTATSADAVLNVKDLKALLKAADLKIVSGAVASDIVLGTKMKWTNANTLTLDAYRGITFNSAVTVEGDGNVTLITNDGGTGGDYTFTNKGKLSFWDIHSRLVINGASFRLAKDVKGLAHAIAKSPSGYFALSRGYDASVDGKYWAFAIPTAFSGVFEGLGHSIDNLSIGHAGGLSNNVGFLEIVSVSGIVRDLALTNLQIPYDQESVNVAALTPENHGIIANVSIRGGAVSGGYPYGTCVAGLAGYNMGTIVGSHVVGTTVYATGSGAGFVCGNVGTIAGSGSSASVAGSRGSLVTGFAVSNVGLIELSYGAGSVHAGSAQFGNDGGSSSAGFVGSNDGTIDRSWSSSSVDGGSGAAGQTHESDNYTAGFVLENTGTITRSYVTGAVEAYEYIYMGGFVENNASGATISASYSVSHLTCEYCRVEAPFYGGTCPTGADDYWDSDTVFTPRRHRTTDCGSVASLTDAQLKSGLPSGFDPAVWGQSAGINNGYPYLLGNPPPQ